MNDEARTNATIAIRTLKSRFIADLQKSVEYDDLEDAEKLIKKLKMIRRAADLVERACIS